MPAIRHILFASDFSPASRPAFRKALDYARIARAKLTVMHVLGPVIPALADGTYISPTTWAQLEAGARTAATKQLDALVRAARKAGARATSRLDEGVPSERIGRVAKATRADLLVLGTHGRTGISRFFLGSVAARVVATAPCPVLTVKGR